MVDLSELLRILAERNGSDLHLKVGAPPMIRVDGLLERMGTEVLMPEDTERVVHQIIPSDRRDRLTRASEADFAHSQPGVGRFRVNVFRQRGSFRALVRLQRIRGELAH